MSHPSFLSEYNLTAVKVLDPVLNIKPKQVYAIIKSGQDNLYSIVPSGQFSNSQVSWNINTPSESIVVSRKMYLKCRLRFELTGADEGKLLISSNRDAPRFFPLANSMTNLNVRINNSAINVNMADVLKGMQRYTRAEDLKNEYSTTPSYPDQSQEYSEYEGFLRSELNSSADSIFGAVEPRGAFPIEIETLTNTQAVFYYTFFEPLMISPLQWGAQEEQGLIGVRNLSFLIQWKSDLLSSMWSRNENDGQFLTSNITFDGSPEMHIRYITPSELTSLDLPKVSVYEYHDIFTHITSFGPLAAGETRTSVNDSLQLSIIPNRLVIMVMKEESEEFYNRTDTYCSIESIAITMGNRSGMLSEASQEDLWRISRKNGCNLTFREWSGQVSHRINGVDTVVSGIGSVLSLKIPEDLTLPNSDFTSPGLSDKLQVQIRITYKNLSNYNYNARLVVLVDTDGVFNIEGGLSTPHLGIISREDILNAKFQSGVDYTDVRQMYGGDFMSDVKKFVSKIPAGIEKGAKFIQTDVMPIVNALTKVLPMLGLGVTTSGTQGGLIIGGKGGKKISRTQLKSMLEGAMN